jgi:hypothetical protein
MHALIVAELTFFVHLPMACLPTFTYSNCTATLVHHFGPRHRSYAAGRRGPESPDRSTRFIANLYIMEKQGL